MFLFLTIFLVIILYIIYRLGGNIVANELFTGALPETLSEEEQKSLIIKSCNGDKIARDLLIVHNIRLVVYQVLKKFSNTSYDADELISIGIQGLIKAVNSFDASRNCQLATYASKCIDNEILMFIKKNKHHNMVYSINDKSYSGSDNLEIKDILEDDYCFEDAIDDDDIYCRVGERLDELPYNQGLVIALLFGFKDGKCYSQNEVSKMTGISQSYISRLYKKGINEIRRIEQIKTIILKK